MRCDEARNEEARTRPTAHQRRILEHLFRIKNKTKIKTRPKKHTGVHVRINGGGYRRSIHEWMNGILFSPPGILVGQPTGYFNVVFVDSINLDMSSTLFPSCFVPTVVRVYTPLRLHTFNIIFQKKIFFPFTCAYVPACIHAEIPFLPPCPPLPPSPPPFVLSHFSCLSRRLSPSFPLSLRRHYVLPLSLPSLFFLRRRCSSRSTSSCSLGFG